MSKARKSDLRVVLAVTLVSLALLAGAKASEPSIVGDWYEEATYGGGTTLALSHFRGDGTFTVIFRKCLKPAMLESTDTGTWTYVNGRLRMTTQTTNGFWTFDIEDYQTLSNDGKVWVYKSISGSAVQEYGTVTFRDIRVTHDSKMTGCDLTS